MEPGLSRRLGNDSSGLWTVPSGNKCRMFSRVTISASMIAHAAPRDS